MGKDQELLEAARTGNISLVEKLLHSRSKSSNFAASLGIRVGAHVNCQDQNGYTPLHHASLNGHSIIVQLLLDIGASVNISDNNGSRPLHLAAWNGVSDIVKILLTSGPSFASVNEQNADKETALHCAAQHGHRESVKILLDNHADPELRNVRDESALDLASQYGRLEVVRLLLSCHPKLLAKSPERFTPLHLASRNGHRGVVELLLVHGADINKVGANGTALHEAALFGKYDVVSLLLKRGAETGSKDSSGRTALELVSQLDTQISRDIAKLIVDMKAKNEFDKPTNVFVASPKLSRNQSRSFGEADLASREPSRGRPSFSPSFRYSRSSQLTPETSKSPGSHRIRLRRTSSARSARSLPRLVSTASFHGNRSIHSFTHGKKSDVTANHDWSIRQHHPSIDMFPVTPTRGQSQTSRKTSTSEPSSPTHLGPRSLSPIHPCDTPEVVIHGTPLRLEDDSVFFPGTPTSGRPSFETFLPSNHPRTEPKAVIPLKPPADDPSDFKNLKQSLISQQVPIIISSPSIDGDSPSIPQSKLTVDVTLSDTPPPLPKKSTASPPCEIEPNSPPLPVKKNSLKSEDNIMIKPQSSVPNENVGLKVTGNVSTGSNVKEIQQQPNPNDLDTSSRSFTYQQSPIKQDPSMDMLNTSISSISDLSPTVKSPAAPRKPQRNRPALSPPPLPPKPAHMMQENTKKPRPPSPSKPPPLDDEEDISDDEEIDSFSADYENAKSLVTTIERRRSEMDNPTLLPDSSTVSEVDNVATPPNEATFLMRSDNLSPPLGSSNSGSTSTISTVIFVPSSNEALKSDGSDSPDNEIDPQAGFELHEDPASIQCEQALDLKSGGNTPDSPGPAGKSIAPSLIRGNQNCIEKDDSSNLDNSLKLSQNEPNGPKQGDSQLYDPQSNNALENMNKTIEKIKITQIDMKNSTDQYTSAVSNSTFKDNDTSLSPTLRSPSPPFSPPSPNTAMLQVSSAIQKAMPADNKSSVNNKPMQSSSIYSIKTNNNMNYKNAQTNNVQMTQQKTVTNSNTTVSSASPSLHQSNVAGQQTKSNATVTVAPVSIKMQAQSSPFKPGEKNVVKVREVVVPSIVVPPISSRSQQASPAAKPVIVNNSIKISSTSAASSNKDDNLNRQASNSSITDKQQTILQSRTTELLTTIKSTAGKSMNNSVTIVASPQSSHHHPANFTVTKSQPHKAKPFQLIPTTVVKISPKPQPSKTEVVSSEAIPVRSNTLPKAIPPQVKPRQSIGARPWNKKDSDHRASPVISSRNTPSSVSHPIKTDLPRTKSAEISMPQMQPTVQHISNTEQISVNTDLKSNPIIMATQVKPTSIVEQPTSNLNIKKGISLNTQIPTKVIVKEQTSKCTVNESDSGSLAVVKPQQTLRPSIILTPKPYTKALTEKNNQIVKPALPKKRLSLGSIRQTNKAKEEFSSLTLPRNRRSEIDTNQHYSKSMSSFQTPVSTASNKTTLSPSNKLNTTSPVDSHKGVLVRCESKTQQMRPQSDLYYTATEVKRARICSTKSVVEIPAEPTNTDYENIQNENPLARNKRSSSLGPQVKTPYPQPKPRQVQIEVQTPPTIRRRVSDAYTQTYPPKLKSRQKLSLQKSKSVDKVHHDTTRTTYSLPSSQPSITVSQQITSQSTKNMTESPKHSPRPVPRIKQALVTTPTQAKKLQRPKKPTKPTHLLNYKPSIKAKPNLTLKHEKELSSSNDSVFKPETDNSSNVHNESSLANKSSISVLSLNTSDEWNDALSDQTEDMNFPKEVRRFRGLIRGSSLSYRSRFTSCGARDPAYESDEFEYDYNFDSKASYSRVNASLQPDDEFEEQRFHTVVTKESANNSGFYRTQTKLAESSDSDNYMAQDCDVIVSKKPAQYIGEPGEKRRKEDLLLLRNTVTSQGGFINPAHSRDSSYDNNNNNNNTGESESSKTQRPSTSSLPLSTMSSAPTIPSPMSDGLPDFGTIVDTVTAVRSKASPHGSTSGVSSSSSSQSSTLPKQDPMASFNENDEWAQIANVMKSVGNTLNKGPVYAQEFEETFWRIMTGSDLPRKVGTWLSDLNLSQYEEVLCGNGFDNINFLASDILEEQDLIDMNIQNESHRRRMLDSAKNLPKIRPLSLLLKGELNTNDNRPVPSSVNEWLLSLALGDLEQIFDTMGFNTLEKVLNMKETEIAGIVRLRGHRKRIRASLGISYNKTKPRSASQGSGRGVNKVKSSPPLPRSPLLDTVNFFKDYSQTTTSKVTTNSSLNLYGTASSSSSALTNYSSLSDQVVPISISEEPEVSDFADKRNRQSSSTTQYTRSQSASTEPVHRRHSRDQNTNLNRFPSQTGGSLNPRNNRNEKFTLQTEVFDPTLTNSPQEDDLLSLAISRLTDGSVKKSTTTSQENKENINMSTSDSTEIRVPDARRASYLSSNGDLVLRPPNETTEEEVTVSSWCHDPNLLIKSCCNYQAYYLGSMLVQEVKGVESTVEACNKMKKSTDSMKKIPTVTLSISYKGVKFIDSKSKHEIAEHEIHNISFASQDADDLATLAYITRDARTGNHYCHVFRVTTLDVAYEIILTLGQAFEVAYQLILKEKSMQEEEGS